MQRESVAGVLAVFVLLGGAGLAVAADGPATQTRVQAEAAQAEADAAPYLAALDSALAEVQAPLATLATSGRDVAGKLQALDIDGMRTAVGAGNDASGELSSSIDALMLASDQAAANVDAANVAAATRDRLDGLVAAADVVQVAPTSWRPLAARAQQVGTLVESLNDHDAAVFSATTAGRAAHWDDALKLLDQAGASLSDAANVREQLKAAGTLTPTLDNLLVRYAAYNAALTDLYTYMRDSGDRTTDEFSTLNATVDRAQAALPEAATVLNLIVDEAAGSVVDANLAAIEAAASKVAKVRQ